MTTQTEGTRSAQVTLRDMEVLGERVYSATIFASATTRSDNIEVVLDGMDFTNYEKNPVVMWIHDQMGFKESAGIPIGRTIRLLREGDSIRAEFEFLEGDPFAERVRNAWEQGFLKAASIGWKATESERLPGGGIRDVRSELLEWSIVPVPADPDALRDVHSRVMKSLIEDPVKDAPTDTVIFDLTDSSQSQTRSAEPHQCWSEESIRSLVQGEIDRVPEPEDDPEPPLDFSETFNLLDTFRKSFESAGVTE